MNITLDNAEEVDTRKKSRTALGTRARVPRLPLSRPVAHAPAAAGRILLKGDNVALVQRARVEG